jgi:hypothetical protein
MSGQAHSARRDDRTKLNLAIVKPSTVLFGVPNEKVLLTGNAAPSRESESSRRFHRVSVRNVTFLFGGLKTRLRTESAARFANTRVLVEKARNPSALALRDFR